MDLISFGDSGNGISGFELVWGGSMDEKNGKTGSDITVLYQKDGLELTDIKFVDLLGVWHHFTVPSDSLNFDGKDILPFDGSSIRGFQDIHESDMSLIQDLSTYFVDPFSSRSLSLTCDVYDPVKKEFYSRDPRYVAKKAENYLKESGVGDTACFGPELEFFIFDSMRYDQNEYSGYFYIDSAEGIWNSGQDGDGNGGRNLGYKQRFKEGYFPVSPHDSIHELRNDIVFLMRKVGLTVERHHHEVATAGQCEIGIKYASLTKAADNVMLYKYAVKNVAKEHGKVATFMPKPLFNDNGSGMHVHQSIWKSGKNIFAGDGYAGLSETALYYIGGLIEHAPALCGLLNPTTNSYKRLVPGFEAPVNLAYSYRNRSAAIRIPVTEEDGSGASKRIEYRPPDPSCNPYLAFAAMLMAGMDGVKRKLHPGEPVDYDIYHHKENGRKIETLPGRLEDSLDALESDNSFLLEGNVFTKDLIETWIDIRRKRDVDAIRLRPHPWEFYLYHDV